MIPKRDVMAISGERVGQCRAHIPRAEHRDFAAAQGLRDFSSHMHSRIHHTLGEGITRASLERKLLLINPSKFPLLFIMALPEPLRLRGQVTGVALVFFDAD